MSSAITQTSACIIMRKRPLAPDDNSNAEGWKYTLVSGKDE